MLTFDEAIQQIAQESRQHHNNPDAIWLIQYPFMCDIKDNKLIESASQSNVKAILCVYELAAIEEALHNAFVNGVNLGVSIGVRMEKNI